MIISDRTGLSTKCALIKIGFKNLRTGTEAKFRPFVDALEDVLSFIPSSYLIRVGLRPLNGFLK